MSDNIDNIPPAHEKYKSAWIRIENKLPQKPEVIKITKLLGWSRNDTISTLLQYFIWLDEMFYSSRLDGIEVEDIDDILEAKGFGKALLDVGWLKTDRDGTLIVSNWERYFSESMKKRHMTAVRQRRHRAKTDVSQDCHKNVTPKEENSGEEKKGERESSLSSSLDDDKTHPPTSKEIRNQLTKEQQTFCSFLHKPEDIDVFKQLWDEAIERLQQDAKKCLGIDAVTFLIESAKYCRAKHQEEGKPIHMLPRPETFLSTKREDEYWKYKGCRYAIQ